MTNETKIALKNIMYNQISNALQMFAYEMWNETTRNSIKDTVDAIVTPASSYNILFEHSIYLEFDEDTHDLTLILKYKENPDDEKFKVVEFKLSGSVNAINEL